MINWHNIRPIHSSLNDGFEELVCQLAYRELIDNQMSFRRIGKPDGGKECYWELDNGNLHMWQAKYFTSSFSNTQWSQIDESVKRAIDNHPDLVRYYVCSAIDLPDGKVTGKTSLLDKWKAKVTEWQNYATSKGMSVDFEYWGSSELIARLSKRENEGLTYFWFNKEELSDDWIEKRNRESINALGPRYSKELNFDLPIAQVFDGLSRDSNFKKQVNALNKDFVKKHRAFPAKSSHSEIKKQLEILTSQFKEIQNLFRSTLFIGNDSIPLHDFKQKLKEYSDSLIEINDCLHIERENKPLKEYQLFSKSFLGLDSLKSTVRNFENFLESATCIIANRPYLLITGSAGMGKSHLIADIVEKRKERNQQSLLLLGENFNSSDMPWTQILQNQLRKNQIDEFIFLGALNAKAESQQSRIVFFIDAINEANGRKVWHKKLKSFIESFENYPWLGLVISIRNSFVNLICPIEDIDNSCIVRIRHEGFADVGHLVVSHFFNYYKIVEPASPLLNPEFNNPLFLKLFCKSLADSGLHIIPPGYNGFTSVIDYFLSSINKKLSAPEELDYDERIPIVKNAVNELLTRMVDKNQDFIEYIEANELVTEIFKPVCNNNDQYLNRLISEGVLNDDVHWDDQGKNFDVIYFAYQRFQDHLTVSSLLDRFLDADNVEESFSKGKLNELVKNENAVISNQNIIEALCIQLPERTNKELFEVVPHIRTYSATAEAFIESLVWRESHTFNENSLNFVNEIILCNDYLFHEFLEANISSAMNPDFYFNAEKLHNFLMACPMKDRDLFWTTWLQDKYEDENTYSNPVKRLIDYAWNIHNKTHLSDDSILLGCMSISWFFTSPNRYLRDAATKGVVNLLQERTHLISGLLDKFKDVNDVYVLERVFASAYGAVLRSDSRDHLKELSEYIYQMVFNKSEVFPHILLRDYARGIIEYSIYLNYKPNVDITKIRPPYSSTPLPDSFPSVALIDKKYKPKKNKGNYNGIHWGSTAILSSMTTEYGRGTARYGDFGRYVFQHALSHWNVDYDGLSNYAVQRIFEIGYDPDLFSKFDSRQGSGREAGSKERIGKKYQWIIFYELLARVADHYQLKDESSFRSANNIPYEGPWYPYVRDIDPTILIKEKITGAFKKNYKHNWWFNQSYSFDDVTDASWIVDRNDIPEPDFIIEVHDKEENHWIWLEFHPEWNKEAKVVNGEKRQRKILWYQIRSYLIKRKDLKNFQAEFNRNFYRRELPEARNLYTLFDREYYWSKGFDFFNTPYYSGQDWFKIENQNEDETIAELHRTAEEFLWEEEYDCSKTSNIQYFKPSKLIYEGLNIKPSNKEGEFIDQFGELVCFDPSVANNSFSGLLVKKDSLISFLEKEDLAVVWSVIGEKQFVGSNDNINHPYRLNISGIYSMINNQIEGTLSFEEE